MSLDTSTSVSAHFSRFSGGRFPSISDTICKVLGVQLDLRQSGFGTCLVTNTAERVEELVAEIDEAMKSNLLPRRNGRKAKRASSVRKFTDVWQTLQKTAEGPLEPCHGWQADSV